MLERIFSIDTLWILLLILYVPACIGLIVIVLLQRGKGTGFGGAFGVGGGSEAVFGPRASRSLPVRLTYIAAGTFMTIALVMSLISHRVGKGRAPELIDVAEEADAAAAGSRFSDLGIGTGRPDEDRVDESALTAPLTTDEEARTGGQPGQVWSEEHGHWHDAPPGGQPGQVWSEEHGHWHDAPAVEVAPAGQTPPETAPADDTADAVVETPIVDGSVTAPEAAPETEAPATEEAATEDAAAEETTPEPEGTE